MKVIALVLLFATPGFAQPEAVPKTTFDFEEDVVEGRGTQSDLEWVNGANIERFRSLVEVRTDFNVELLRSAEDI